MCFHQKIALKMNIYNKIKNWNFISFEFRLIFSFEFRLIYFPSISPTAQHFHDTAYRADNMQDMLRAMNEFIDDSLVLPAGNWDKELLLPILKQQNRKNKERWQHLEEQRIDEEDEEDGMSDITDGGKLAEGSERRFKAAMNPGFW